MKISIIVPTYNRPVDLDEFLISVSEQSLLPNELIIIDDGDLQEIPAFNILESLDIDCIYRKKKEDEKQGAATSRNIGIDLTTGDVTFLLEDDLILDKDFIKNIMDFYAELNFENIGGAGGVDINMGRRNIFKILEYIYNVIFLISPVRPYQVTISGFSESVVTSTVWKLYDMKKPIPSKYLGGGNASFTKEVLQKYRFSEDYDRKNYMGHDKHLTVNISREYNLYIVPTAKFFHKKSKIMRANKFRIGYNTIRSAHKIFDNYVRKNKLHFLLFMYSSIGLMIKRFLIGCLTFNRYEFERVGGLIKGLKDAVIYEIKK